MKLRIAVPESLRTEGARVLASLSDNARLAAEAVAQHADADLALRVAHETLPSEDRLLPLPGDEEWSEEGAFAVLARPEPRDALVTHGGDASLEALASGARVALAGALRREMLGVHRTDLRPVEIGDPRAVPGHFESGEVDAWIDAAHVVRAVGLGPWISALLEPTAWATAPGRGSLLLEWTTADDALRRKGAAALASVEDIAARSALRAERLVLEALGVSPDTPVGVMARPHGPLLRLRAWVPAAEGRRLVRAEVSGRLDAVDAAARKLAEELRNRGALDVLAAAGSV